MEIRECKGHGSIQRTLCNVQGVVSLALADFVGTHAGIALHEDERSIDRLR